MMITARRREQRLLKHLLLAQIEAGVCSIGEAQDIYAARLRAAPALTRLRLRLARWIMP